MEKLISLAQVEQLIDEMIEEIKIIPIAEYVGNPLYIALPAQISILETLKSKLSSLPTEESGWIALTKETKPSEEGEYFVIINQTPGGAYRTEQVSLLDWDGYTWADGRGDLFCVTHYMKIPETPLPKPPLQ